MLIQLITLHLSSLMISSTLQLSYKTDLFQRPLLLLLILYTMGDRVCQYAPILYKVTASPALFVCLCAARLCRWQLA